MEPIVRLHLNENTAGCSPAVMDVLSRLGRGDAGVYPDYDEAVRAVAGALGLPVEYVLLTNGMDEGILAATAFAFRDRRAEVPEAVGVAPAFDMYGILVHAFGGRLVSVPMDEAFTLPSQGIVDAVGPATRIAFITNPHNPSGAVIARSDVLALANALSPTLLFVDEAYVDFSGITVIDTATLDAHRHMIVGRTFSKAYGLAGLRAGVLAAHPDTLAPMRQIVPPYSLNAWAAAALPAAVRDTAYRDWYVAQSAQSRDLIAAACARLGLRAWPSRANFVLVRVPDAPAIVAALAARGVRVRDRSREAGCEQCIRITAGLVADTERLLPIFEDVICAAR
jgi:histidinol-phosphate aminotransferase